MNRAVFLCLLFSFLLSSCSTTKGAKAIKKELAKGEERFSYTDKNGQFLLKISSGFNKTKKENIFFSKRLLEIPGKDTDNILEQSVTLSELGRVKSLAILRPKISQYNVWFSGKKYFSELKMNPGKKAIDVRMVSPETQWNGTKQIKLPSTKALYCFFSQVVECAKTTGFLDTAIKKEAGSMNFYVIWEGYPYLNETFSDFPSQLISRAQFEFDGKTKENEYRLNLKVAGQSIFFVLDEKLQMKKMFWVSQGISMVSKSAKKTTDESTDELKGAGGSIE